MRGLKPNGGYRNAVEAASHLLQMRGLKQLNEATLRISDVASFTDAWIETPVSL